MLLLPTPGDDHGESRTQLGTAADFTNSVWVGRVCTRYLPADVPLEGVVLPSWRETVLEEHAGTTCINRQYYELCVLQRLERALKCKEVWMERAYAFRNPSAELPANWAEETQRTAYYQTLQ